MWSGPRNISTALMRSWENRPDCSVVDEPFYACYLKETGLEHPCRKQILQNQSHSWQQVIAQLTQQESDTPLFYLAERKGWILTKDWDKYYTTPHLIQDYKPVSINDKMTQAEILEAYYYVNAAFVKRKLRTKYGKHFYANPHFFKQEVFSRIQERGIGEFSRLSMKVVRGLTRGRVEPTPQDALHHH